MRFSPVLLSLLALGCHPSSSKKEALNPDKLPPDSPSNIPAYTREDLACLASNALAQLTDPAISLYENGSVSSAKASLVKTSGAPHLAGSYINLTAYDFESQTDCSGGECKEKVVKGAQALPICRADGKYARNSIEGVAVTSYAHLDRVFHFHEDIAGGILEPVRLFVLPKIIQIDQSSNATQVSDNAAYVGSEKAVLIYPKGRVGNKLWPNMSLWESAFVVAHEGAHHIFQKHYFSTIQPGTSALANLENKNFPVLKLNERDYFPSPLRREAPAPRIVSASDVVGAVNEGFADLFAFYALGEKSASIASLTCFASGRELTSSSFLTGDKKTLSGAGLQTFFNPVVVEPTVPAKTYLCDVPDYQDIHHIGAIVVHGLHRIFTDSERVKNAADKTKEKAKMANQWVDQMALRTLSEANLRQDLPPPPTFLGILVEEGVKLGTTDGRTLSASQCQTLRDVFPIYDAEWKRLGTFSCR